MGIVTSLIINAAMSLGLPCERVFVDAALIVAPRAIGELSDLDEFASISCKTDNPDVIWQIAHVETNFRFKIVAFNGADGRTARVMEGEAAKKAMAALTSRVSGKSRRKRPNVDIGVMQMNWRVHGEGYGLDATKMSSPSAQVKYLVDKMAPELVPGCGARWVGCYHSWSPGLSKKYIGRIRSSELTLKKAVSEVVSLRGRGIQPFGRDTVVQSGKSKPRRGEFRPSSGGAILVEKRKDHSPPNTQAPGGSLSGKPGGPVSHGGDGVPAEGRGELNQTVSSATFGVESLQNSIAIWDNGPNPVTGQGLLFETD